ncbi:MAG: aldo/keto reductase [Prevotellaceae bacterium]|jgi:predicted aldo/keto reductase-like oxidoreductase|nr:aldo/keto reductase [Prevotellaceae bacterium]
MKTEQKDMRRRDFLKVLGAGAVTSAATLYGCGDNEKTAGNAAANVGTRGEADGSQMTYRTSKCGDKVSLLGYGCMRWPMTKDSKGEDVPDQEQINRLIDYALAHGVNYFDTAPVYVRGLSEQATGIALKRHPRDKYFIATKLSTQGRAGQKVSREFSIDMYRNSFKELQTDYIDYYLLHNVTGEQAYRDRFLENGMIDFLLKEKEAGRIRQLGWSFHGQQEGFDWLLSDACGIPWDFVQIQMNYVDWKHASGANVPAEYLYGELHKRNIPAVLMEPLQGGRLSALPDHVVTTLKSRDPEGSVASWAFRFAGTPPGVLTALSGMTYMEHLQDNLHTYCPLHPLTDADNAFLEEVAQLILKYPTIPCNNCDYCMPCPYGVDIPGILLHYNKCVNEGTMPESSQDPNYRKLRRDYLIGYDRAVSEKLRQASHCTGCNECTPFCPQYIRIPQQLQRIDKFIEDLRQGRPF